MTEAGKLIGQLAAGHADELDERMGEDERPFAAMTVVWTNKTVRWRTSTPPHATNKRDILKLIRQLQVAVGMTGEPGEAKGAGRIG